MYSTKYNNVAIGLLELFVYYVLRFLKFVSTGGDRGVGWGEEIINPPRLCSHEKLIGFIMYHKYKPTLKRPPQVLARQYIRLVGLAMHKFPTQPELQFSFRAYPVENIVSISTKNNYIPFPLRGIPFMLSYFYNAVFTQLQGYPPLISTVDFAFNERYYFYYFIS